MDTLSYSIDSSLLADLKRIELKAKRAISADLIGNYRSAFRGSGLVFSDLRQYCPGDDVRHIHWKVTARTGKPFIKTYEEERQLNIILVVDISNSTALGVKRSKHRKALDFAALLSLLAMKNQDSLGLCLFAGEVEQFYASKSSRSQFKRVLTCLLAKRQLDKATDLNSALNHLIRFQKKPAIVFVISDFYTPDFSKELKMLSSKHDLIGVLLEDAYDSTLAPAGIVEFEDAESGKRILVDSSSGKAREQIEILQKQRAQKIQKCFASAGADLITIGDDLLRPLHSLMQQRTSRY